MISNNVTIDELLMELEELKQENEALKNTCQKDKDSYILTEKKFLENENRLKSIIRSTSDWVWEIDENWNYNYSSETIEKILGYTADEIIGKSLFDLMLDEDKASIKSIFQNILQSKSQIVDLENWSIHKDGHKVCLLTNGFPIINEDGKVIGLRGADKDITERKLSEYLLEQTRQNYESFFNTIDEFLFVLDEQGNILHTNKTVLERLGYSKNELINKSVLMVHPEERREEAGRIVGEMLSGKTEFCPVPIITKDGIQIPVETKVSMGVWDGNPAIFGVTKDISRIMLSEEKFSKVFYLNPSACGLSDLKTGKYVELNKAFYNLLGFNEDEVIGKTTIELGILTKETIERILPKSDIFGNVMNEEADLVTKNGVRKQVILSSENIYIQNNEYRFTVVNDITDLKKSQEILRESEQKYQKIFTLMRLMSDTMPDMLWSKDLNKQFTFVNKATCDNLLGAVDTSEPIGKTHLYFADRERAAHPENDQWHTFGELCEDSDEITLKEMREMQFEEFGNIKGEFLLLEVHKAPLYNNEGELIGIVGSARDITERKIAEKVLELRENHLTAIIENQPGLVWLKDIDGRFLTVNEAFAQSCGEKTAGDVLGKTDFDIWPIELAEKYRNDDAKVINHKQPLRIEESIYDHKERKWFETFNMPILDESGIVIGTTGFAVDITDRKKIEMELHENEKKYRELFESNSDGITIFKLSDNELPNTILDMNQNAYKMLGYTKEEMLLMKPGDIEINATNEDIGKRIYDIKTKGFAEFEATFIHKSGYEIFVEIKVMVINYNNQPALMNIVRDITERKRTEEYILKQNLVLERQYEEYMELNEILRVTNYDLGIAKEKAEESDRLKTAFLQNISHEIRTPLNGLLGFLSILKNDSLPKDERDEYINLINESANRLLNTINDIVEISQINAGQVSFLPAETNIGLLIDYQIDRFKDSANSKGLEFLIKNNLPENIANICTDNTKLNIILENLIDNAIKFTTEGTVEFGLREQNDFIEFSVKDTGTGIPKSKHQAIFDRFMQVDASNTRKFEGSGLGLSIAKAYVEMLGGKIWVESEVGIGSTFYFTIKNAE